MLAAGELGGLDGGRRIPEEFDEFVQHERETFRGTCDADLEKMEELEQVRLDVRPKRQRIKDSVLIDAARSSRSSFKIRSPTT